MLRRIFINYDFQFIERHDKDTHGSYVRRQICAIARLVLVEYARFHAKIHARFMLRASTAHYDKIGNSVLRAFKAANAF